MHLQIFITGLQCKYYLFFIKKFDDFKFRTNCVFSPNDKMIVTGVSTRCESDEGKLIMFDRDTFNKVTEFNVSKSVIYNFFLQKWLKISFIGFAMSATRLNLIGFVMT
jgi:hypothetical protein